MQLTLASGNPHKAEEFAQLFDTQLVQIKAAPEKLEIIEDGHSFQENAFKKAKGYFDHTETSTLADDSGLVLPARPDILGIHSARYADHLTSYTDKNVHLLEDIASLTGEQRKAYFVCYICLYISAQENYFFEGRVHGVIANKPQGEQGFGYDPIFVPDGQDGRSLAELSEWKSLHSHRAKAARACQQFIQGYEKR